MLSWISHKCLKYEQFGSSLCVTLTHVTPIFHFYTIPPEKVSKSLVFWHFQGVKKWNIGIKWVKDWIATTHPFLLTLPPKKATKKETTTKNVIPNHKSFHFIFLLISVWRKWHIEVSITSIYTAIWQIISNEQKIRMVYSLAKKTIEKQLYTFSTILNDHSQFFTFRWHIDLVQST